MPIVYIPANETAERPNMYYKVSPIAALLWRFGRLTRKIPLLKRMWPSLLKKWVRLTWENNEKIVTTDVGVFALNHTHYIERLIAFYGDYENEQVDYLLSTMQACSADVFLDIGSNIGYYAIAAATRAKPGRIIAFEPDERNVKRLKLNLKLSGLANTIEIKESAVSDKTGKIEFLPSHETTTEVSLVGSGENSIVLDSISLDDEFDFKGKTIFIKMDIEGHELQALNGARRLLRENRVFMQLECFDENLPQVLELLESLGMTMCNEMGWDRYLKNFDLPV